MDLEALKAKLYQDADLATKVTVGTLFIGYCIIFIFVDEIGKIGLGINTVVTLFILLFKYYAPKEKHNSMGIAITCHSILAIGNLLLFYSLFNSLPIAFSMSIAILIAFLIGTKKYIRS